MRIVVIPDLLEDRAQQMAQSAAQLYDIDGRLSRALGALDWEARQKANVEGLVNAARGRARDLAGEAERLARFLTDRASAFRQADAQGVQSLEAAIQKYHSALHSLPTDGRGKQLPDRRTLRQHAGLGTLLRDAELLELLVTLGPPLYLLSKIKVDNGLAIVRGPRWLKEMAGLSTHLTRLYPQNVIAHWLRMEGRLSFGLLANALTALDLVIAAFHAHQDYGRHGRAAVVSSTLVDAAVSIGLKKVGALSGGAIGGTLFGPFGALAGYAVGGYAGIIVADWLRATPYQQSARNFVQQSIESVSRAVDEAVLKRIFRK
jgi:hypothetical protein